jgi:hypothetical protein
VDELADVVAMLRAPGARWRTLQAVGREWRHYALLDEALSASTPQGALGGEEGLVGNSGERGPEQGEEIWRWWSDVPDRLRVEFAVGGETVTVWLHGSTWWSWSPSQGAETNEGRQNVSHDGGGPGRVLVAPARAARVLDFELVGPLTFLSRPAWRLRARLVSRGDSDLDHLGSGADEYGLVVDAERGFLLRAEARLDAEPFRVLEMTEVVVDADVADGVFTPEAPDGGRFEYIEPVRDLTLEELPGAVAFQVFVPAQPPGRDAFVQVFSPKPRSASQPSAVISYFVLQPSGEYGNLWVSESAQAHQTMPQSTDTWKQVDDFLVSTDHSEGYLRCKVLLEREGTHIHLESTAIAEHDLIDLGRSSVPLNPGPRS